MAPCECSSSCHRFGGRMRSTLKMEAAGSTGAPTVRSTPSKGVITQQQRRQNDDDDDDDNNNNNNNNNHLILNSQGLASIQRVRVTDKAIYYYYYYYYWLIDKTSSLLFYNKTIRYALLKNISYNIVPSNERPNPKNKLLGGTETIPKKHLCCVLWTLSFHDWWMGWFRLFAEGTCSTWSDVIPFRHWPSGFPNIKVRSRCQLPNKERSLSCFLWRMMNE